MSKEKPIYHITFAGVYAGQTYCGINKEKAKADGHRFGHLGKWIENPEINLCDDCREIYEGDEET